MPSCIHSLPIRPCRTTTAALAVAVLLFQAQVASAADGQWAGKLNCTDGWGNPLAVPVEATASGAELRIKIGETSSRRPLDAKGEFTLGIGLGRDERVAHLRGSTAGANLTISSAGGEVICAASLASAGTPAAPSGSVAAQAPAPVAPSPEMLLLAEPTVALASNRIADVIELLERERDAGGARLQQARALADAAEPAAAKTAERVDFLARRAFAAWSLDREAQARADFRRGFELARDDGALPALDRTWFQYQLGLALFRAGELSPALELLKASLAELRRDAAARPAEDQRRLLWHLVSWEGSLVRAQVATGNLSAAEASLAGAESGLEALLSGPTQPHERATAEAAVAQARAALAVLRGRPEDADTQYRAAIAALATYRSWPKNRWLPSERIEQLRLEALLARAEALAAGGRTDEAVALAREVIAQQAKAPAGRPAETASAARVLAVTLAAKGRPADAAALAALAIDVLSQAAPTRDTTLRIELRLALAQSLAAQRRWADALAAYDALRADLGNDRGRFERALRADPTYSLALLRAGKPELALAAADTVLAQARLLFGERDARTAEAAAARGAALAEAGKREAAMEAFRAAMPRLIGVGVEPADDESPARAARLRVITETYLHAAAQGLGAGPQGIQVTGPQTAMIEAMLRAAEAARGRKLLEAIAASVERSGLADRELAELVRREQDAGRWIKAMYDGLAGVFALPAGERDGQDTALRRQIAATERERAELRRSIAARAPALARFARPAPPSLAELRAVLKPREALVAVFVGERRSYAFAVAPQGPIAVVESPVGDNAVAEAVLLVRAAMAGDGSIERMPAFDVQAAYQRLYAPLLKPLEPILAGASELLVVADGALMQIPWAVLPTAPSAPKPASDGLRFAEYGQVPWLIRRQAVVHLPSATALVALRRAKPAVAATRPFVGFGDPVFAAAAPAQPARAGVMRAALSRTTDRTTGRASRIAAVESLPPLPDTRVELQQIAQELGANTGSELFLGPRASETEVRRARLDRYRVIAFATHGLAPGDIEGLGQPALALSSPRVTAEDGDGLLTMAEVLELRLAADWVVLSACNTAGASEPGDDMLSGLANAFFYAGARSLLVTHWAVETVSARLLTTGAFAAKDVSRAEALRRSMLALIDGTAGIGDDAGKSFSYAHPIFWGAYALVGDPG